MAATQARWTVALATLRTLRTLPPLALAALAALAAPACGHRNNADPVLIPGGGVSSGEIARFLNVYVVDGDTGDPIAGAFVQVDGETEDLSLTGTTNTDGLATFEDRHLRGPQTVSAAAPGFANSTWFGVNGANVTINLNDTASNTNVETADVRGTIDQWDMLPAPAANHLWIGFVGYTFTENIGGAENSITQPTVAGLPANACIKGLPIDPPCDWHMIARTGAQAHYYLLIDDDTMGTPLDMTDDTLTLAGWGVLPGLDLTNGAMVTAELLPAPVMDVDTTTVTLADLPAGLDTQSLAGFVSLGEEGLMAFTFNAVSGQTAASVGYPLLTNELTTGYYRFIAVATDSATMTFPPTTYTNVDDLADLSGGVDMPAFLEPASGLSLANEEFSYAAPPGASVYAASIHDPANDDLLWSIAQLDVSAGGSFVLPALPATSGGAELPFGDLRFEVTAIEVAGFDAGDFSLEDAAGEAVRASSNSATVTR